ncbi:putative 3-hydroxyacyl-CoA dehydrogenase [Diplonema papillatum]|nr:putative 3-hydroxyacyl-CoA dehydrogenase [Diplonema papillatum]
MMRLTQRLCAKSAAERKVMVLGAGTMGAGIAQVTAASGGKVSLVDLSEDLLSKSQAGIEKSLTRIASKKFADNPASGKDFVASAMACITFTSKSEEAASGSDLIIEAITENIDIKKKVWASLDKAAPASCLFASNTSSLRIADMAAATSRADKFGGLHFFSPVPMMKLVEVVKADCTSDETANELFQFAKDIGKTPIRCKDTKGFVVNRLLIPLLIEAVRMVERGDATMEDVDTAMKLGAGHPMGPIELADAVGLDVTHSILKGWHAEEPEAQLWNPSPLLDKLVKEGKLGNKTGGGFYTKKNK